MMDANLREISMGIEIVDFTVHVGRTYTLKLCVCLFICDAVIPSGSFSWAVPDHFVTIDRDGVNRPAQAQLCSINFIMYRRFRVTTRKYDTSFVVDDLMSVSRSVTMKSPTTTTIVPPAIPPHIAASSSSIIPPPSQARTAPISVTTNGLRRSMRLRARANIFKKSVKESVKKPSLPIGFQITDADNHSRIMDMERADMDADMFAETTVFADIDAEFPDISFGMMLDDAAIRQAEMTRTTHGLGLETGGVVEEESPWADDEAIARALGLLGEPGQVIAHEEEAFFLTEGIEDTGSSSLFAAPYGIINDVPTAEEEALFREFGLDRMIG